MCIKWILPQRMQHQNTLNSKYLLKNNKNSPSCCRKSCSSAATTHSTTGNYVALFLFRPYYSLLSFCNCRRKPSRSSIEFSLVYGSSSSLPWSIVCSRSSFLLSKRIVLIIIKPIALNIYFEFHFDSTY